MNETDLELLRRYCSEHCEEAFAEIVRRHLDLVHSAAVRQVRSAALAEEVSQSTFIDLARHAHQLAPNTPLAAWLYQVAYRTAIDVLRRETRRQLREQAASEMNAMNATASEWTRIEPLLEEAMHALEETDRAAVLLRFFENKSLRDVGQTLGTSEDAAQKRVSRALEKLREFFSKRGVAVGASGLAAVLSTHAVQAAPVGLSVTIASTAALAGAAVHSSAVITTANTIAMSTLQKTVIAAALTVAIGTSLFEARQVLRLRGQLQRIQQGQAANPRDIERLTRQGDETAAREAALQGENEQLRAIAAEVPKLRGEVARLRTEAQDSARLKAAIASEGSDAMESAAKSWLARAKILKDLVQQKPEASIPEFQLLTEEDWLKVARKIGTDSDEKVLSELRHTAESRFVSRLQPALRKYLQANSSQAPLDLAEVQPYFELPIDEGILQRWKIAPAAEVPNIRIDNVDWMVTQRNAVDEQNDMRLVAGPNGSGSTGWAKNARTARAR